MLRDRLGADGKVAIGVVSNVQVAAQLTEKGRAVGVVVGKRLSRMQDLA